MPSNRVSITDAAWVQVMPASASAFAIVFDGELDPASPGVPASRIKWKGSATQPTLADTDFSTAGPGDQFSGLTTEPVWALAFHSQGSAAIVHDG